MFLTRKIDRMDELEEKIEVLLAQNSHLVDENESLIKLVQQKKAEVETWKARFEGEYTNSNIAEAEKKKIFDHLNIKDQEHQGQIDKLLAEISRLHDEQQNIENLKQIEIGQLKNRYESETMNQIQNLKRSQYGNHELQELSIKKLRAEIEGKEHEIESLRREAKLENERLTGEISYLRNEIKKIEGQKVHELDLIRTENENTKNNLIRANKKSEEELRNLHDAKVKRLVYELEEKRTEIEDLHGKSKKGGKENEAELSNLIGEKSKLRVEMKENDNRNRQRLDELTAFYEKQLDEFRKNAAEREKSMIAFYDADIASLKEVIKAKQAEIDRLLALNKELKTNEESRLADIRANNAELKQKIEDIVKHYEREVELMKIKISQLYEADLEALRSHMRNSFAAHNRETEALRSMLDDLREQLAKVVQEKIDLRVDYENRINEFKVIHERDVQLMRDQVALHEKNYENQTSKASLTHISHNQQVQKQTLNFKEIINEKRNLEKQIENKNKEIDALNLKVQKMEGFHKREVSKLQAEVDELKQQHQDWLNRQTKDNEEWNKQRSDLKNKAHESELKFKKQVDATDALENKLKKEIEKRNLDIADLKGKIQELNNKISAMGGDLKVAAEGAEKTRLEHESLLNTEKDKYVESKDADRSLRSNEATRVKGNLEKLISDLKHENELLQERERQWKIREGDLKTEIGNLLDSVNKRSQLEEHVINIGLSNNYFKNIAEIFKK